MSLFLFFLSSLLLLSLSPSSFVPSPPKSQDKKKGRGIVEEGTSRNRSFSPFSLSFLFLPFFIKEKEEE